MKVIKRDGRAVDYNRDKIIIAIEKANKEVKEKYKATRDEIKEITNYIEDLDKKRILVEDIQDIIERKLMEFKRYELAKKYIVYRYTRALVRKNNTTDESILGLIKNQNKEFVEDNLNNQNSILASTQRDYIAGEVSKDLTKRILLPEKITKMHDEGILYFHNAEYFLQPIFNSCLINISDMLENKTVINGVLIEKPQSFRVACIVTAQIILAVSSSQYGEQSIDLKYLGKYLRMSKNKFKKQLENEYKGKLSNEIIESMVEKRVEMELIEGVQTLKYQIDTLITIKGKPPFVTLFLNLDEDNEYIEENAMIIEEILKQNYIGVKNEKGEYIAYEYFKLIYVLYENNCLKGGKYDYLTKLAIKCSSKRLTPSYISSKKMKENYKQNVFSPMGHTSFLPLWKDENNNYKFEGRFNQGIVSINLPQIAIVADGEEAKFWELLDERLEFCYEALMCRHYALLGTLSDTSPIHWKYGAIARMKSGEKIDSLLKNGYSTLSLGYIGIYEVTKIMKGVSHTKEEGKKFAIKIMKHLNTAIDKWNKETNLAFVLDGEPEKSICYRFAKIDREKFGEIKDITDKGYYTNSFHIDEREEIDEITKLTKESEFQKLSLGGGICYINISNMKDNLEKLEKTVSFVYDNVQYVEFNNI